MRNEQILGAQGVNLLAYWRLAATEQEHAATLLQILDLPTGARVVDLGCGTGELTRLCQAIRPDLSWTLVNVDAWQLAQCPDGAQLVEASMINTGLPAGTFCAVIVAYAMGYCNVSQVLKEAARLLIDDGKLVLHELYASSQSVQQLSAKVLGYQVHAAKDVTLLATLAGFDVLSRHEDCHQAPGAVVDEAAQVFHQFDHGLAVLTKSRPCQLSRRAALQFSGGKDSLACLYLLKPWVMAGLPVYWTHTGDTIPETLAVVERVRQWVPDFRVIEADVLAWKRAHGTPSDVTTAHATWMGQQYAMTDTQLVGRFDCCWHNLMKPMHDRMLADGVDLVIRGTKLADTGKVPANGATEHYDVLLPLLNWSHAQVFDYLNEVDAPISPVYQHFKAISAPECLHCSAWWDDGKAQYLKQLHPEKVQQYQVSLQQIRAELSKRLQELDSELKECESWD